MGWGADPRERPLSTHTPESTPRRREAGATLTGAAAAPASLMLPGGRGERAEAAVLTALGCSKVGTGAQ